MIENGSQTPNCEEVFWVDLGSTARWKDIFVFDSKSIIQVYVLLNMYIYACYGQ